MEGLIFEILRYSLTPMKKQKANCGDKHEEIKTHFWKETWSPGIAYEWLPLVVDLNCSVFLSCNLRFVFPTILDKSPWIVLQYSYFSVISRFSLKKVQPFRNFLAVLPPPTPYKVETRKKFWTHTSNIVCGVRGAVGPVWIGKRPRNASVLRLLSMILVCRRNSWRSQQLGWTFEHGSLNHFSPQKGSPLNSNLFSKAHIVLSLFFFLQDRLTRAQMSRDVCFSPLKWKRSAVFCCFSSKCVEKPCLKVCWKLSLKSLISWNPRYVDNAL